MTKFLAFLAVVAAVFPTALTAPTFQIVKRDQLLASYDYVIVGGGPAGLTVANRLSENPKVKVLVIEGGDFAGDDPNVQIPRRVNEAYVDYHYKEADGEWMSEPLEAMGNRTHMVYAGKAVGGGTAINGMLFDRGAKSDYDAWKALGNPGWGWNDLLPYFKKSETFTPPTEEQRRELGIEYNPAAHGTSGPIKSSYQKFLYPSVKYNFAALNELGIKTSKDGADGNALGVFWSPNALDNVNGVRSYAVNYHEQAESRANYHILVNNYVHKVDFSKKGSQYTATGVTFSAGADAPVNSIKATKEVILAAGALQTPKVLQLSGLGGKSVLNAHGIKQLIDLPGVGFNLQDHPTAFTAAIMTNPPAGGSLEDLNDPALNATAWETYVNEKSGPYTIANGNTLGFIPLPQITDAKTKLAYLKNIFLQRPETYLPSFARSERTLINGYLAQKTALAGLLATKKSAALEVAGGVGGGALSVQKSFSRGTVHIRSANPFDNPKIDFRAFSNPLDMDLAVIAVRFFRKLQATKTLQAFGSIVVFPGPEVETDEQIREWVRATAWPSFAHMSGTAAMLARTLGGVVDSKLKVYGTTNLRVVDASIMPLVPSTHIQSTVYAVAEKAADIIKAAQ
ncbi:glucose-methanol-choline oxidoreductase-like protein [Ascobolus immersus RN42]|uniref:Glucose-methanol-choline oxidoreductase-like protein n=1 Tax=Ascobolus immersus RN42 TaxID=1160509 RepID=A0A3N4HF82_ASCIM|nr:glucose-methanol-choline oxidoreductase-like protein [Ascobolus immersus RN42]